MNPVDSNLSMNLTLFVGCKGLHENPTEESRKPEHNRDNFLVAKNDRIYVKIYKYSNPFLHRIGISRIKICSAFEEVVKDFNNDYKKKITHYILPHIPHYNEVHCTGINEGFYFTKLENLERKTNLPDLVMKIGNYFQENYTFFKACLCKFLQHQEIITNVYDPYRSIEYYLLIGRRITWMG